MYRRLMSFGKSASNKSHPNLISWSSAGRVVTLRVAVDVVVDGSVNRADPAEPLTGFPAHHQSFDGTRVAKRGHEDRPLAAAIAPLR